MFKKYTSSQFSYDNKLKKLKDVTKFTEVPKDLYHIIPVRTRVAYLYRDRTGKEYPIVSAFIKDHYKNTRGEYGTVFSVSRRNYSNLHKDILNLYLCNDEKTTKKLEKKYKKIASIIEQPAKQPLTRSSSVYTLSQKTQPKRPHSITHSSAKRPS